MVVVSVRDEDRVERSQVLDRQRLNLPSHVKDAAGQQRIRQQPQAPELYEDSRVTDVCKPACGGQHYDVAPMCSCAPSPSSSCRQPLRISWTWAAPTIGSSSIGNSTG